MQGRSFPPEFGFGRGRDVRASARDGGEGREVCRLQSDAVAYHGQIVALVVTETPEVARHAAALVGIGYDAQAPRLALRPGDPALYTPDRVNPANNETDTLAGDVDLALRAAPVSIDCTYSTPNEHSQPMEPHACIAHWTAACLTIHDSDPMEGRLPRCRMWSAPPAQSAGQVLRAEDCGLGAGPTSTRGVP